MGSLNALSKVYVTDSRAEGSVISTTNEANAKKIAGKYQELLDWDRIYLELLSFRAVKQWNNMSFTKDDLKQVISNDRFTLYALKTTVEPSGNFENLKTLEDIVIRLLHNYIDRCYQKKRNEWEKRKFEIVPLNKEDKNIPTQYLIQIEESATDLIARAEECIKSEKVYTAESRTDPLPNAYYEGHIYQPLLAKADSDKIVFFYQGLNEKERQFVNDLAFYLSVPGNRIDNAELFLLRNLTRGKGIGFFSSHSFYPDFILWIKRGKHQQVVFIEPHGMVHSEGIEDPKTNLHKYLKEELEPSLNDKDISFDSFIISVTPFDSFIPGNAPHLQRGEYCLEHHLLFMETRKGSPNPDYIKEMFSITLTL